MLFKQPNVPFTTKEKWQFASTIIGGFLIHFILGNVYSFNNISPYLASYMRVNYSLDVYPATFSIGLGLMLAMTAPSMYLTFVLLQYISVKKLLFLACLIYGGGSFISSFFMYNFTAFIFFQCIVVAIGKGMAYGPPLATASKWFIDLKGLSNGLILGGFGMSSVAFNAIQYLIINPNNIKPVEIPGVKNNVKFYTDRELLKNVKFYIQVISFVQAAVVFIGAACIFVPKMIRDNSIQAKTTAEDIELVGGDKKLEKEKTKMRPPIENPDYVYLEDYDVGTLELIKVYPIYRCLSIFAINAIVMIYVATIAKTGYGSNFYDDKALTIVGILGAVGNTLGRIIGGRLTDLMPAHLSLIIVYSIWLIAMGVHIGLSQISVHFLAAAVFLNYLCLGGFFAIIPSYLVSTVGARNLQLSLCFMFLGQMVFSQLSSFMLNAVYTTLNIHRWIILFYMALTTLALFLMLYWRYTFSNRFIVPKQLVEAYAVKKAKREQKLKEKLAFKEAKKQEKKHEADKKNEASNNQPDKEPLKTNNSQESQKV